MTTSDFNDAAQHATGDPLRELMSVVVNVSGAVECLAYKDNHPHADNASVLADMSQVIEDTDGGSDAVPTSRAVFAAELATAIVTLMGIAAQLDMADEVAHKVNNYLEE